MRKLIYYVATTLDGFIAAEDGTFDGFVFEGDHMQALTEEYPETLPVQFREMVGITDAPNRHFDTVLMGRNTYQVPGGLPSPYAHLRQYVISSTITGTPDDVEVISTNPLEKVRELKQEDGADIWLCGGGRLAAELLPEIDGLLLKLHPVVFGAGIGLFDGKVDTSRFQLTDVRRFDSGVAFMTYAKS
ncbi:dihydrofolate reductase [Lentzea tibetensis]|uniref:Dihydrofolate reductase n=1 Tax=Lentzea tibetensis TaxID=2591470 RepID=A0A563EG73_9PSEU|nr:dihydrofolate reductase family protein [Lentzea tibetensis]TWP44904.1 dihydrofolate reductase [Lentzea tibetensis]